MSAENLNKEDYCEWTQDKYEIVWSTECGWKTYYDWTHMWSEDGIHIKKEYHTCPNCHRIIKPRIITKYEK